MEFQLHINCDNSAFETDREDEVSRILGLLSAQFEFGTAKPEGKLKDLNGNTVGSYYFSD